jgi:hypothetical protein
MLLPPLPQTIADDGHLLVAGLLFLRQKVAAERGRDAQQPEEIPGCVRAPHLFRLAVSCQVVKPCAKGGNLFEYMALRAPVEKFRGRSDAAGHVAIRIGIPDQRDAAGIRKWERAQQYRVDDAENRGVGADSDGQRQHRHDGEAPASPQHPPAISQVLPDSFHVFRPERCESDRLYYFLITRCTPFRQLLISQRDDWIHARGPPCRSCAALLITRHLSFLHRAAPACVCPFTIQPSANWTMRWP